MAPTRSLALLVPRAAGEATRRTLSAAGLLRSDLRIREEHGALLFPISAAPAKVPEGCALEEREFDGVPAPPPVSYRALLDLPEAEAALLPRAFDIVGDIVLIRLPKELEGRSGEIGAALLKFVPGARVVGLDRGVHGVTRVRRLERLAGTGAWSTRHQENGLSLEVDLERAYFSPRLAREHARIAALVRPGESVLDLCCGIGPFSITIARDGRARSIVAVDLNPDAIALLRRNAERLGLADRIRAEEASIESFCARSGAADRVVFNLPREGIKYAPLVGTTVGPGGSLHYYEVTEMDGVEARSRALLLDLPGATGSWSMEDRRPVHPYSPTEELLAFTVRRAR